MPPAARVGDTTTHGGVIIGPGRGTVLIGGMPAAVMLDLHICAIPPIAHPPITVFVMGSTSVFIGGMPALRTSDMCGCVAAPAVGDPTVMIGG